jgi:hypothetical protein
VLLERLGQRFATEDSEFGRDEINEDDLTAKSAKVAKSSE